MNKRRLIGSIWWASVIAGFYIIWNRWVYPQILPPNEAVIPVTFVGWAIMMAVLVPGLYWIDGRYDLFKRKRQWLDKNLE